LVQKYKSHWFGSGFCQVRGKKGLLLFQIRYIGNDLAVLHQNVHHQAFALAEDRNPFTFLQFGNQILIINIALNAPYHVTTFEGYVNIVHDILANIANPTLNVELLALQLIVSVYLVLDVHSDKVVCFDRCVLAFFN
jgi:hypothetical protein